MSVVLDDDQRDEKRFALSVPVVIVGAGACGLVAALAARDAGAEVLVLEQDRVPAGSTALSSGFIPAAHTRFQKAAGVIDSPEMLAADVTRKNHGQADPLMVDAICRASGLAIEWLADLGIPFILVDGFLYPGHSALRMHALPEKSGQALMNALLEACRRANIDILCEARVTTLHADATASPRRVRGVSFSRRGEHIEELGCDALILACSGFGGNPEMVRRYIPELSGVDYFGHRGNRGDAMLWGEALGAAVKDMTAYQGHGSVAIPQGILITWALMMEGGIQVNALGKRFSNEHEGYSEQCVNVLNQPGGFAWNIYDERLHRLGLEFPDYRDAVAAGAVRSAESPELLAEKTGLPAESLGKTMQMAADFASGKMRDAFGRDFAVKPALVPPYYAVKVGGSLFHTQGGLCIDAEARVVDSRGKRLPNLFAGGGAARGISGAHVWGYLSGNGLLSAISLGWIAGRASARLVLKPRQ